MLNEAVATPHSKQAGRCCWDRNTQPCSCTSQCDGGGEGCVATGTISKKYGRVTCAVPPVRGPDSAAVRSSPPPAVPYFLANNYPGYPTSGGLTHVLNTVPVALDGMTVFATQDAYFSYEFVECADHSRPLDLRCALCLVWRHRCYRRTSNCARSHKI